MTLWNVCEVAAMCFLLPAVALLAVVNATGGDVTKESELVLAIEVMVGAETKLPCDIQPPDPCDEVHLVIWFKEGHRSSIYSFDSRGRQLDRAEQTMDVNILEGRAFFRYRDTPATLTIENVKRSDAGMYRCRVDFGKSPTRNSKLKLSVIVPPEKLVVMDDQGSFVLGDTSRPYNEGAVATIKCISVGGEPLPAVTWWQDSKLVDDSFHILPSGRVENVFTVERLSRQHFPFTLSCHASNSNLLKPVTRTLTLDMNLKPMQVRLLGEQRSLLAEKMYKIQCEVLGSRPAPTVTWYMGSVPLKRYRELFQVSPRSNITVSTLYITPTSNDNGKVLTCRAVNSLVVNSSMEAKWTLDVHYVPVATLKLGGDGKQDGVREGSEVHFHCNIKSNPWVNNVIWRHNEMRLYNNSTMGIIVANQSLVLHSVTWERTGPYTCVAENEVGYGESNAVSLDVKYCPFCQTTEPQVVGLSQHHEVSVVCRVSANPRDVSFTWTCNNTGETLEPSSSSDTESTVTIPPGREMVHHTILCTAHNEVGVQKRPCAFYFIPAETPQPVRNCTVLDRSAASVRVKCSEGHGGGVPERFNMDVFRQDSGALLTSITAATPSFTASGIDASPGLHISVYAFNNEGNSEVFTLTITAAEENDVTIASASIATYVAPVFGSLIGVIIVLGSVVAAVVVFQHVKGRGRRRELNHCSGESTYSTIFGTSEEQFYSIPLRPETDLINEHEPDVIPVQFGIYTPFLSKRQ